MTRRPHRIGLRIAGAAVAVAVIGGGIAVAATAASGRSPGELMAQAERRVRYSDASDPAGLPVGLAPSWLPRSASDIHAVRPGASADSDAARIVTTVGRSARLPASCEAVDDGPYTIPFDGATDWPDLRYQPRSICGRWTVVQPPAADGGKSVWYLWRD